MMTYLLEDQAKRVLERSASYEDFCELFVLDCNKKGINNSEVTRIFRTIDLGVENFFEPTVHFFVDSIPRGSISEEMKIRIKRAAMNSDFLKFFTDQINFWIKSVIVKNLIQLEASNDEITNYRRIFTDLISYIYAETTFLGDVFETDENGLPVYGDPRVSLTLIELPEVSQLIVDGLIGYRGKNCQIIEKPDFIESLVYLYGIENSLANGKRAEVSGKYGLVVPVVTFLKAQKMGLGDLGMETMIDILR